MKQPWRKVIMTPGKGSVSDKKIEAAVRKVIKLRESGQLKPHKHVTIRIVADK